jgi:hypothetical protein
MSTEDTILERIRKWWRPLTCVWLCGTMAVHGVILPLAQFIRTGELATELMGLSALVTSIAAAFAVREWGKVHGTKL